MSATSSRSASKGWANSARRLLRRDARGARPRRQPRHCERSEAIHSATKTSVDCFVASLLAMTADFQFKDSPNEAHLLPRLAVRAKGPHPRDRTRPDRQDRIRAHYRCPGPAQRRVCKTLSAEKTAGADPG